MPFSCYLPRGGASNSSMVGPPGPPDHGCFVPFAEWEKTVTVVVSSIAFVIAFTDAFLVRQRIFYQFTMRSSFTFLLLIPGLCVLLRIATRTWGSAPPSTCPAAEYACSINLGATDAALNILGVYVSSDTVENFAKNVLTDITAILRAWFLYEVVMFTLNVFRMRDGTAFGSTGEAVERVGDMLEKLSLPAQKMPPVCAPFWLSSTYKPGKQFLRACVNRMLAAVLSGGLVLVLRIVFTDFGIHTQQQTGGETQWEAASIYIIIWNLLMTITQMSSKLPLDALLSPITLPAPEVAMTLKLRKNQFLLCFLLMGGVHGVILLITTNIKPVEVQHASHLHTQAQYRMPLLSPHLSAIDFVTATLLSAIFLTNATSSPPPLGVPHALLVDGTAPAHLYQL